MLSLDLALQLRDAGLAWTPAQGDRFVVPGREMDEEVFVLSDVTVEIHQLPSGPVVGFNGTTEWALDSLDLDQVLWLPREDQLRSLLGPGFRRLQASDDGWEVVMQADRSFSRADAEDAYAVALLDLLAG